MRAASGRLRWNDRLRRDVQWTYANANDSTALLNDVWGAPGGDVWIASNGNEVLRIKAAP